MHALSLSEVLAQTKVYELDCAWIACTPHRANGNSAGLREALRMCYDITVTVAYSAITTVNHKHA
jgi:hypothetical protein